MDKRIEKIKAEIAGMNQQTTKAQIAKIAHNLLGTGYVKFKKVLISHNLENPLIAKIEIFRRTIGYINYLYDEVVQLERELSAAGTQGVELYFPDESEYVETIEAEEKKQTLIRPINDVAIWKRAAEQAAKERDGIPVTGLKE